MNNTKSKLKVILFCVCSAIFPLLLLTATSISNTETSIICSVEMEDYNVWMIFTRVSENSVIRKDQFRNVIVNILNVSSLPLKFNFIVDNSSRQFALESMSEINAGRQNLFSVSYKLYDKEVCLGKIKDIVDSMMPRFSTSLKYYKDSLFYISLGLHRIAPDQNHVVLLDLDIYLKKDIRLLFDEFSRMKPPAFFALAPELSPHYHQRSGIYRRKHPGTTFGAWYHPQEKISNSFPHPRGYQGYNSGVVLLNLDKMRNSPDFVRITDKKFVVDLAKRFDFHGDLGDQDFYTLLGYESPEFIHTLNCGFNRQLCRYWESKYKDDFENYFKCEHEVIVLHGNCKTKISKK